MSISDQLITFTHQMGEDDGLMTRGSFGPVMFEVRKKCNTNSKPVTKNGTLTNTLIFFHFKEEDNLDWKSFEFQTTTTTPPPPPAMPLQSVMEVSQITAIVTTRPSS